MVKPLFIPLKTEYYEQFEAGTKTSELRKYGNRWNEKTCTVGRAVTLSKGYGKQNRISGTVVAFEKMKGSQLREELWDSVIACYGTLDVEIAAITIKKDL